MAALPAEHGTARTLLLALDAVPYRVAAAAVAAGAFAGWTRPSALVAPFPSLTHPGFAALFAPFGVAPSWGYEVRHFDREANRVVGGNPLTYRHRVPPWAVLLDAPHRGVVAKVANYVSSPRAARREVAQAVEAVLASPHDVVLAYVGATDGVTHLYPDDSLVQLLVGLDAVLADLTRRHAAERRRPLRLVLFSDHGCGRAPVHYTGSLRPLLRDAGLRVVDRLERPDDVVAPTFGIVNYGASFQLDGTPADAAAEALSAHPAVELAAYLPRPGTVQVLGHAGRCRVRWRGSGLASTFCYDDDGGDVLGLDEAVRRLDEAGRLDADGYAAADEWLQATAGAAYPDPLRRLVDALAGDRVRSRASVLLSLGPGWSWGWRSAFAGGMVRSGRLKGTHGGLDRESTLGFLLVSDPTVGVPAVVAADRALAPFAADVLADRARRSAG